MKNLSIVIPLLALLFSTGCAQLEKARAKRDADPAAYDAMDLNRHYFSQDPRDWVQGS
ncbi:hypothetical protein SAMN05216577_11322 [Pseudomonas citronellolis]|uniref:Lipoprotein n=1 Tax=Pseudomonas citronellolis TaxID=53408 RepID=A0AAQ1KFY2_9PSED|nr:MULTISPECIES: hypothetical protein [Pseudomonas]MCL6692782.1 hypothetical protein [Pseudomonas sp. R3.Fl]MCP1603131.1 hypothetical protein [Pseudomonas citronellolis]MCP1646236.1 hypothetical protein [Pseudomonas citronellolis]MCP1654189.1 hypothetical protein [Pseudomonas citronellolis]MCP1667611.1 hypothetical protein [Pseudomonas citronellolis]